ncbi:MAG: glycosyltransferase family 4 protein [bacterium]|nr:glycosyltransferase family 4 protein [bacterium]
MMGKELPKSDKPRIAFFFIGAERAGMLEAVREGRLPDSGLRGANFFARRDDWEVDTISTEHFEKSLPRFVRRALPMSLLQLLMVPRLLRYDAVIASDAFLLGALVSILGRLASLKLRRSGTKWVYIVINSGVLIRRHVRHPVRSALLRFCWSRFAAIVCLAEMQQKELIQFGIKPENTSLIRFGIDTRYFSGAEGAVEGATIISIGKDISRDYVTLLAAAKLCSFPIEIFASRKNIPPDTEIPANVTVGYDALPLEGLRATYVRARFIVVSLFPEEAFGGDPSGQTVLLEALASRRAVLVTRRPWLKEYLRDSDYLAVPPSDPAALARAMEELWRNAPLRDGLGKAGQETVRRLYSSERFAMDLMALTERIMAPS